MASIHIISFLIVILVLQPWAATSNFLGPIVSPIFEDVCKKMGCGKGTCRTSNNSNFGYECECEEGWKQARPENDDDLKFLPCVIPNCTLNFSCSEAPSAPSEREKQANQPTFNPCHWADCGGGTCNMNSPFTHRCDCKEGYYNLLNATAFPCFRECALGMDCSRLGINIMNNPNSPPSLVDNSQNHATSIPTGNLNSLILSLLYLALAFWR